MHTSTHSTFRIAQAAGATTEYFLADAPGSVRQLTDASGAVTYTRAYDPDTMATVTIVLFKGNNPKRLYESKANYPDFTGITWSPDGNYIAFGLNLASSLDKKVPTTLFVIDRMGNIKVQVSDESIGNIDWTPDSKNIIYFSVVKSHISLFKVIDLHGSCTEFQSVLWPIGSPNFSFDGNKIAFSSLESKIYIADTKSVFGEGFWDHGVPCQ